MSLSYCGILNVPCSYVPILQTTCRSSPLAGLLAEPWVRAVLSLMQLCVYCQLQGHSCSVKYLDTVSHQILAMLLVVIAADSFGVIGS